MSSALQRKRAGEGRITPPVLRAVEAIQPSRLPAEIPKAGGKLGSPPRGMPAAEARIWRRLVKEVSWLSQSSDRQLVAMVCHLTAEWEAARDVVRKDGPYVMTKAGDVRESPAAHRERQHRRDLSSLLPRLGMTPADIGRIAVEPGTGVDPRDPLGLAS